MPLTLAALARRGTLLAAVTADLADIAESPREALAPEFQARDATGSALGLAIVREIVLAHRGLIAVESAPGEGTTMTLLPPTGPASQAGSHNPASPYGRFDIS